MNCPIDPDILCPYDEDDDDFSCEECEVLL